MYLPRDVVTRTQLKNILFIPGLSAADCDIKRFGDNSAQREIFATTRDSSHCDKLARLVVGRLQKMSGSGPTCRKRARICPDRGQNSQKKIKIYSQIGVEAEKRAKTPICRS